MNLRCNTVNTKSCCDLENLVIKYITANPDSTVQEIAEIWFRCKKS